MGRKSSQGNPYHDAFGRFCSRDKATGAYVNGRSVSLEEYDRLKAAGEVGNEHYTARTIARKKEEERAKRKASFDNIINGCATDEDLAVLAAEGEYQEQILRNAYEHKSKIDGVELERRNEYRIAAMAHMMAEGKATDVQYVDSEGIWDTSRTFQHDKILDGFMEKAESVPHNGECLISGGLGGAGKSTVLRNYLGIDDKNDYVTINADDIKEEMAERGMIPTARGLTPMECSELVHEEASYLSKQILNHVSSTRANIILDITMSSYGSVKKRCDVLQRAGYKKIQPVFVDIRPETSRERAKRRFARGLEKYTSRHEGNGGRPLPSKVIDSNLTKGSYNSKNAETLVDLSNGGIFTETPIVYDNDGTEPRLLKWKDFVR